jgi:uncharacterized damage-inducible protein DinB
MNTSELLIDAHSRIQEVVHEVVEGLDEKTLATRPGETANSIAWLVWHLTRVQDDHLAGVAGDEQVYTADGWASRFGLPYADDALGYGQSSEEVGAFVLDDPALLTGYHAAVQEMTTRVVERIQAADGFDRVVDERWDPPVTVAVRLVSVVGDTMQHVGQAAYLKGLVRRR